MEGGKVDERTSTHRSAPRAWRWIGWRDRITHVQPGSDAFDIIR